MLLTSYKSILRRHTSEPQTHNNTSHPSPFTNCHYSSSVTDCGSTSADDFDLFSRPLRRNASAIIHWSWPLILRNSSSAHRSNASMVTFIFRFLCHYNILMVHSSSIHNRLSRLIGAQYDKHIGNHRCFALIIQLNNLIGRQTIQCHLDH